MSRSRVFACALGLALAAALLPTRAFALWPHPPGTSVVVAPSGSSQSNAQATSDGAGGMIVAWMDFPGTPDIYVKRVDAGGTPLWATTGVVVCDAAGVQDQIAICDDGQGGAFMAWRDQRSGSYDIYAAHVSADGTITTPAGGAPICTAAGDQGAPAIVNLGFGAAVVAWNDPRNGDMDVYAQRFNIGGSVQWSLNGVPVAATSGDQSYPSLAVSPTSLVLVAWNDTRSGPGDIYVLRVSAATGAPFWTPNGVLLCGAAGNQWLPAIVTDGGEGAIVAWSDERSGLDIYARRVTQDGTPVWAADGVPLAAATGDQAMVRLVPDGAGGAIAMWDDDRSPPDLHYYAQRVAGNGAVAWIADGIPVCTTFGERFGLELRPDGLGGAIAAWADNRFGSYDIFTQRIDPAGQTLWQGDGVRAIGSANPEWNPALVPDGSGGALLVGELELFSNPDLLAKRVDRFGEMGAEPAIAMVTDVPNDQGGQVRVAWNASALDVDPLFLSIADYQVFRSVPAGAALARLAGGARMLRDGETPDGSALLRTESAGVAYFWEYVGVQSAFQLPSYSFIVPTAGDSVAGSNPLTAFMVRARGVDRAEYWDSAPDSGYSVDDLAPAAPAPFSGQYVSGSTVLAWGPNGEADLAGYRLYRGTTPGFVPGPGNLVAALAATSYVDPVGEPHFYKLSAVDVHGNESPFTLLQPDGTVDVGAGAPVHELALAPMAPNPLHGEGWVSFALPRAARVRLEVLDAAGRRVTTIADREYAAGEHALRWSGAAADGRALEPGLYFVRLEALGRTLTRRFANLR